MVDGARQSLLQSRYGDQTTHTRVAGPETIAAAKKKRAEQRRTQLLSARHSDEEDFVPLDTRPSRALATRGGDAVAAYDAYQGPHPESGLQREEDDLGSGEDEHAAYTGATERIPLGRDAERKRKQEQRKQMRSLIAEATGAPDEDEDIAIVVREPPRRAQPAAAKETTIHEPMALDVPDSILIRDEDEEERKEQEAWEEAQLSRMDMPGARQQREQREPSPHRPAPVPLTAAMPTPTSCLARLQAQIAHLDERTDEESQRRADAEAALQTLDRDEATLKAAVESAEAKSAWFADLDVFVETFAAFLDAKMPLLETLEHNAIALLVDRTVSRQRARALALEDALALFHGTSSASLWVPREKDEVLRPMNTDGPGTAPVREARRAALGAVPDVSSQRLSPEELAHFQAGREELARDTVRLLDDTKAPEFRSPLAADESGAWHPRSLAARFHDWRARFPGEYDLAWGGLAVANAWEFFARYELVQWDPFWATGRDAPDEAQLHGPASGLEGFAFEHELSAYVDADPREEKKARGGDAEASATLVSNAVVPRLVALAEQAYDVWSAAETGAALTLVEQVSYLLDASGWRFQSLVRAFLVPFEKQIEVLRGALRAPVTAPGLAIHPDLASGRRYVVEELAALALNLGRWSVYWLGPHALDWSASERGTYEQLVDRLLGEILWPILVDSREFGGQQAAAMLVTRLPKAALPSDVRGRYSALAYNDTP